MIRILTNFAGFQVGWFACVLGAASGHPWLGPIVAGIVLAVHLGMAGEPAREAGLIALLAVVGTALDSVPVAAGWLSYGHGEWTGWLAPVWITALWGLFGTTLNVSLRWLHGRYLLAAVLGLLAGPASYMAGGALGAVEILEPTAALGGLAALWAAVTPFAVWLAGWADRPGRRSVAALVACPRGS